jgi:hypothetical protein
MRRATGKIVWDWLARDKGKVLSQHDMLALKLRLERGREAIEVGDMTCE